MLSQKMKKLINPDGYPSILFSRIEKFLDDPEPITARKKQYRDICQEIRRDIQHHEDAIKLLEKLNEYIDASFDEDIESLEQQVASLEGQLERNDKPHF